VLYNSRLNNIGVIKGLQKFEKEAGGEYPIITLSINESGTTIFYKVAGLDYGWLWNK